METDGDGVTTLVAMYGCPLHCKYCINKNLYDHAVKSVSVENLYKAVSIDELYFLVTGGGVCFGGHEPLLQADFISEFVDYMHTQESYWKIGVETSLNVPASSVGFLLDKIDYWIVDVKDMNSVVYEGYTGASNKQVMDNLLLLRDKNVRLRVPLIPDYNSYEGIEASKKVLLSLGFPESCIEVFKYKVEV